RIVFDLFRVEWQAQRDRAGAVSIPAARLDRAPHGTVDPELDVETTPEPSMPQLRELRLDLFGIQFGQRGQQLCIVPGFGDEPEIRSAKTYDVGHVHFEAPGVLLRS